MFNDSDWSVSATLRAYQLGYVLAQDTALSLSEVELSKEIFNSPNEPEVTAVTEQLTEQSEITYAEEATTLAILLPLLTEVIEPSRVNETQKKHLFRWHLPRSWCRRSSSGVSHPERCSVVLRRDSYL